MKQILFILPAVGILFYSCNSEQKSAVDKQSKAETSEFKKDVDLPENPCDFITEEMITSNYRVSAEKLELNDDSMESYSQYESCGYSWKKKNYEELRNKRIDIMMNSVTGGKDGKKKASTNDLLKLELPVNRVGVGHFRKFDNMKDAVNKFANLHRVPTEEDIKKLNKEFDIEGDKSGLNDASKKAGKDLTKGIESNLKFTKVNGVGDQAFYDHLNKRLDVRFGTLSFSVVVSTEEGFDKDIEVGKKLAKEVWNKL